VYRVPRSRTGPASRRNGLAFDHRIPDFGCLRSPAVRWRTYGAASVSGVGDLDTSTAPVPCSTVSNQVSHMQRTRLRFHLGAVAALAATAAVGLHTQQQSASSLVDQADPTKTLAASSKPEIGQLIPKSEALWVDTVTKRVGINKTGADTTLHVNGTTRVQSNAQLSDNIGQGAFQVVNGSYTRGWSADSTGLQSYSGVLELNPRGLNAVELNNALRVMPDGKVGIGVENPVMQLDVKGVVRASDTIVSTKPAGAPFLVASRDLTTNLNADLLDGKSAEEFATAAEVAALSALVAAGGSSDGPSTTVASLMDDGLFRLPEGGTFDGHSGIVFPDGTLQTTAYAPTTTAAQSCGTVRVTQVQTPELGIFAVDIDVPEDLGFPVAVRAKLTKRVDELSAHLLADLDVHRGQYGNVDSPSPNGVLGDIVLSLPGLPIAPNGSAIAAGARLVFANPRVTSIEQRQTANPTSGNNQPPDVLVEEVELVACGLRLESLDGSVLFTELGTAAPTTIGGASTSVTIDVSANTSIAYGSKSKVVPLRSMEYGAASNAASLSSPLFVQVVGPHTEGPQAFTRGCRLDLRVVHPHLLSSAASSQSDDFNSPIKRVIARLNSGTTPVVDIELEAAFALTWRLRSGGHGGEFHVEVDLASQKQIRRTRTSTGAIQTATIDKKGVQIAP